jgi:hypothetical protein
MRIDSPISCNAIITGSFTGSFKGDGSQLTGVTAEWDGSHTGNASIDGDLTVSNLITAGNVDGVDVSLLKTDFDVDSAKLAGIEAGATGDQTGAEIKALYEAEANAFTDAQFTKLAGLEAGATGDQTGAEIKALYEAEADTNAFDDAAVSKLAGIEASATGDQTGAEIKALYEAEANAFTDAQFTKLAGIEAGATGDQTAAEIKSAYESNADTNAFDDAAVSKLAGITAGATNDTAELSTLSGRVTDVEGDVSAILAASDADKDSFAEIVTLINSVDTENDTAFGAHAANTSNPHSVTKAQVGLGSVENTALSTYTGQGGALDNQYITNGAGYITSYVDTNTTYTAGTGLTLTGTVFSNNITNNNQLTNGAGYITSYVNTTYSAGTGVTLTGTTFSIGQAVATTSDVSFASVTATGNITAYSDARLKKDVKTIEGALDKTKALRGVEFTRIADDAKSIGVIAQELEAVLPELVLTDDEGMKSVNYAQITGLLIEAVKELSAKVDELSK